MKRIQSLIAIIAIATVSLLAPSIQAEENVKSIVGQFEEEKAAALENYLKKNAEAADRGEALAHLIQAYGILEQPEKLPPLLKERYDSLGKGADADLNVLIGQVARPLIEAYRQAGDKEGALAFIKQVKADLADHAEAQGIHQFFDGLAGQLNQPGVGDAMKIAFTDINGHEIDLAKMNGKVVLVDFWATWCGPCIAELPHVLDAYKDYHDKGFEVIGISLDSDKGALEKFIAERKMAWPQYFDGKGWGNEISTGFGINSIPATFLIGKDGKVAATDLRGAALGAKVAELLK